MKILFTGGHFSPALAIINSLGKKDEAFVIGRRFVFEGDTAESLEYKICKARGIPFHALNTGRLQRNFTRHTIPSLARLPLGFFDALKTLKKWQPDVIVVFGGYIALPVAYAARILKIPIVVHEQTLTAGLANKIIAKFATKICISFDTSRDFFPKDKTIMTGNPVRHEVFEIKNKLEIPKADVLYITGGSSGSHFINVLIGNSIEKLAENFVVIHQTGESKLHADFSKLTAIQMALPAKTKKNYILKKFILPDEIGWVLHNSTLVISRSGINTISELLSIGRVGLFIPLSTGQKNEQLENARFVKSLGMGDYLIQDTITSAKFIEKIYAMRKSLADYKKNIEQARDMIIPDADVRLLNVIQLVYALKKEKTDQVASSHSV